VTFFVIIDPIGTAPMFLGLTQGLNENERHQAAIKAVLIAAVTLAVFAAFGDGFLRFLGISLPALQVAGGGLLFLLSVDMVLARQSGLRSTTRVEDQEASHRSDVAVFPLAIPLIAGPGAMTSVVLLVGRAAGSPEALAVVLGVLAAILLLLLVVLFAAARVMRWLGQTGANVISRVAGVILAALAAQFVFDGLGQSLPALLATSGMSG